MRLPAPVASVAPAALLAALALGGCSSGPALTARQRYIQTQASSPFYDRTRPCEYAAFPPIPVRVLHHIVYLPVVVNGVPTVGVLDTGAAGTIVTPEMALVAGLTMSPHVEHFRGASGAFAMHPAIVARLQIGSMVADDPRLVHVFPFLGSRKTAVGALIGLDSLNGFDFDMDFPHGRLTVYRTRNCAVIDPPWPGATTGLVVTRGIGDGAITSVADLVYGRHISVPVSFDGGTVDATFDTGAMVSVMSYQGARDAGASGEALARDPMEPVSGLNGTAVPYRVHRFANLAIGEEVFHDWPMRVAPRFDRRDGFQMVLGMDYIERHHLWLSLTTNALYVESGERAGLR